MSTVSRLLARLRGDRHAHAGSGVVDTARYCGHCPVCGHAGTFVKNHASAREGFRCPSCRASLRYQAQAQALVEALSRHQARSLAELAIEPGFDALRIYEPGITGPFRAILAQRCRYETSFFWPDVVPGTERDGVQCQNLEALTFGDSAYDVVITSDIFEHVRRPMAGFREVHRVLRPAGVHVFTVPVSVPLRPATVRRVDTSGDADVHLLEPRYHGDGAGGRSLVYTDFGVDLIEDLAGIGFDTTVHVHQPGADAGTRAATFVSRKRPTAA